MDPRENSGLDWLGEDLVLLSVSPADGRISTAQRIGFGLMGRPAEQGTRLGIFPVTRWRISDTARLAGARARLDAIALSADPADSADAAYAGLAHAIGLGALLYRGWENRPTRKRLERIAKGEWSAGAVTAAGRDAAAVTSLTTAQRRPGPPSTPPSRRPSRRRSTPRPARPSRRPWKPLTTRPPTAALARTAIIEGQRPPPRQVRACRSGGQARRRRSPGAGCTWPRARRGPGRRS